MYKIFFLFLFCISINGAQPIIIDSVNAKRDFGAKCDGVTDDSIAIKAAHDALYPLGGVIHIPGKCLFNLVITNSNISLIGDGAIKDFTFPVPTAYWGPANTNNPVIQIGNDTGNVKGFSIHNATVYSPSGVIGIYFAGGASEANLYNISVWNFDTCIKYRDGISGACTGINIFGFLIQSSPNPSARGIYALDAAGGSYTTALHFIGGHINGHTGTNSYAVEIDSVYDAAFTDVYVDAIAEKCFYLNNTGGSLPVISAQNLVLDIGGSTNSAVTLANNFAFPWNQVQGTVKTSGSFKLNNGTYWPFRSAQFIGPLFYVPEIFSQLQLARFPANTNSTLEYISADNDGHVLTHSGGNIILNAAGHTVALPGGNLVMDNGLGIYWGSDSFLSANAGRTFFLTTPTNAILQALDASGQINTAVAGSIKSSTASTGFTAGDSVHDPSAVFQANSITQGILPTRLTTAQRDAIVAPALGLFTYNSTTGCIEYTNALGWQCLIGTSATLGGTANYIPLFTGPSSVGNSLMYQPDNYGVQLLAQNADNLGAYYELQKRGMTGDTNAAVVNDAILGEIRWRGWNGTDYGSTAAAISVRATNTYSGSNSGSRMVFETTDAGEVVREVSLEITSDHKIKIPFLTPNSYLATDGDSQLVVTNAIAGGGTTINPTDGWLPYRFNSTTFSNSPLFNISTYQLGMVQTNVFMTSDPTNSNTGFGKDAMKAMTTGSALRNSGFGRDALTELTTGDDNSALGYRALTSLTTGLNNTAFGSEALDSIVGGASNTAVGRSAGKGATGSSNTAIGATTLGGLTGSYTGDRTTAIGLSAGSFLLSGSDNTYVGAQSGQLVTAGSYNTAIGTAAYAIGGVGDNNTALGAFSLYQSRGENSVGLGYDAAASPTNIVRSVIIGYESGNSDSSSDFIDDVFIGAYSAYNLFTGPTTITNAIVIGANTQPQASNSAQIGTNGVDRLLLNGTVGWYRGSGSPEGVKVANPGSYYSDETNGVLYVKSTGTGNTGWTLLVSGAGDNWVASGTTNSTLPGIQSSHQAVVTNNTSVGSLLVTNYKRNGTTNITAGAADVTANGPGTVIWTNSSSTTITLTDVPTSTSQEQWMSFKVYGDGTSTNGFTSSTHLITWRSAQVNVPPVGWTDYDLQIFGTNIHAFAYSDGVSQLTAWQAIGTGTDFSHGATETYEKIVFGTSGPSFVITNAGTYQVILNIAAFSNDTFRQSFWLTNVTDTVGIAGSYHAVIVSSGQSSLAIPLQITTTGANKSFELWGKTANPTPGNSVVVATNTVLNVVRLF